MKKFALGVGALLIGTTIGLAQSGGSAVDEVLRAARSEGDAIVKKDKAALERLYADDYLYAHSNGVVLDRAADVATNASADSKWTAVSYGDLNARLYGDAAIVTGTETLAGTAKGYVPGARRFTEVWARSNAAWRLVAGASTIVSKDQSDQAAASAVKDLKPKSITGATPDERAVAQQDVAYTKTELSTDHATQKAMQTNDFSFVSRAGAVASPDAPRGPDLKSLVVAYDRVRVHGVVAVVQGSLLWSDVNGVSPGVLRFVRVWIKDAGAWKLAAEQRTPIAAAHPTT